MGSAGKRTPVEQLERMFKHWCENGRVDSKTATKFGMHRKTVGIFKRKHNWQERYEATIQPAVQQKTDDDIAQTITDNLQFVRAVKNKLLNTFLAENAIVEGTISELVRLMEYEDKLTGVLPDEAQRPINYIFNIINGLSTTQQSQLDRNLAAIFNENGGIPKVQRAKSDATIGDVLSPNGQESDTEL